MSYSQPYFSILIPSYNRPFYLRKCLDSILASEFADYEILISDDKSPRATEVEDAVRPYLDKTNIKLFMQTANLQEPGNRNFLVNKARGKFDIILGDDDELLPESLGRIRAFVEDHPGYDLYGLGYRVIDEDSIGYYSRHAPRWLEISLDKPELLKDVLISDLLPFWLYHPATFCCRNSVEKGIPYSDLAGIGDDLLFLFDFFNQEKRMIVIPEEFFCWRKIQNRETEGQNNQSFDNFSNLQARRNIYYLLQKRDDLHLALAEVIEQPEFRERFLFDPIVCDFSITDLEIDDLHLLAEDRAELELYRNNSSRYRRYHLVAGRAFRFIALFGLSGLVELLKISGQRFAYSMRI